MSWSTVTLKIVRSLIYDLTVPYTYSDSDLGAVIICAAQLVVSDIEKVDDYAIDVTAGTIDPDPTAAAYYNSSLIALTCYKAACMLAKGESRAAAKKAIRFKDPAISIDLTDGPSSTLSLIKEYCSDYDKKLKEYRLYGVVSIEGNIIVGPIRGYDT